MPGIGKGGLGKGIIVEQRLSTFTNIDSWCLFVMLLVRWGLPLTVIALVLQVGLLGRMEGRQGRQCPHFCLLHLGQLVWGWEGLEREQELRSCSSNGLQATGWRVEAGAFS